MWDEKVYGDLNMITHAQIKLILHFYAIVYITETSDNFSVMWYYSLGWNMNGNRMLLV